VCVVVYGQAVSLSDGQYGVDFSKSQPSPFLCNYDIGIHNPADLIFFFICMF
jgi:hypothetical protein